MLTDAPGKKKNILRLTEKEWENRDGRQGESGRKKLE